MTLPQTVPIMPPRAPIWHPRLPSMTVDPREALAEIVMAESSTRDARYSAAAVLNRGNTRPGWWLMMADFWHEAHGGEE